MITDEDAQYLATIVRSPVMTAGARVQLLDLIDWARTFHMSPKLRLAVACERAIADYHDACLKIVGDPAGCTDLAETIRRHLGGGDPVEVVRDSMGGWTVRALETEVTLR